MRGPAASFRASQRSSYCCQGMLRSTTIWSYFPTRGARVRAGSARETIDPNLLRSLDPAQPPR